MKTLYNKLVLVWFTFRGESPWSWLRHIQSIETLCNKLSNTDLSEQPWPQLICYASYKLYDHNFRE